MTDNPLPTMSGSAGVPASAESPSLPPMQETAVAVVVAPENYEQAVAEVPAEHLAAFIWWMDTIIQRANAAKKCALVEAAMAMERMELTDPRLTVAGHRYVLRQDERIVWTDLGRTLGILEHGYGIPGNDLRETVSEARVTQLRDLASRIPDAEKRQAALDLIEGARTKRPTQLALVDLDSEYRKKR